MEINFVPGLSSLPFKFRIQPYSSINHRAHFSGCVFFIIKNICYESDRWFRNYFTDEHYTSPPFIFHFPSYIKPEIHFFKIDMKRNSESLDSCVKKLKTHEAD